MRSSIFFVIAAFLYLGIVWGAESRDEFLRVHVLDVGQGDAILISMPDKSTVLIDGGPGNYVLSELGEVLPPWVRKIDYIVLTHPHADHLSGLLDIIERYEIGTVFYYPVCYQNGEYAEFLRGIEELEVEIGIVSEVVLITPGGGEASQDLTNLAASGDCVDFENINNSSIVTVIEYGSFRMLLMGDAEVEREAEVFHSSLSPKMNFVDVLKVGHHCSKTASSDIFLQKIRPELAICSCGENNKFNHPHVETIERFGQHNIDHLRTDIEGRVTIVSNGDHWWIEKR